MTLFSSSYPTPRDWRDADTATGGGDETTPIQAAELEDLEWRAQRGEEFISDADVTGSVSALSKIEAAVTRLGTDGGVIWLPPTRYAQPEGIKFDGLLDLDGDAICLRGPGTRECKISCTTAGAGIQMHKGAAGGRKGMTGGFTLLCNGTAEGYNSNGVFQTRMVNDTLMDIRIESNPGKGFTFELAQNTTCIGLDVVNDGTKYAGAIGYYFDRGPSGLNFYSTKASHQGGGHIIFDMTAAGNTRESSNIVFDGFMIERSDYTNPICYIKAGMGIWFRGGNFSHINITPVAEYDLVKIANDAAYSYSVVGAGGGITRNISFDNMEINGAKDGADARWCNAFTVENSCAPWRNILHVGRNVNPINILNLFNIKGTTVGTTWEGGDTGASGSGANNVNRSAASGRVNRYTIASNATLGIQTGIENYNVTGTTDISTIGASYSNYTGRRINLFFSGSLSLLNTGNISMAGSSFPVSSGKMVSLVYDGTNYSLDNAAYIDNEINELRTEPITLSSLKAGDYTLVIGDLGTIVRMQSSVARTLTVPSGVFAAGDVVQIMQVSTGVVTIAGGATLRSTVAAPFTMSQYGIATLTFVSSTECYVSGAVS